MIFNFFSYYSLKSGVHFTVTAHFDSEQEYFKCSAASWDFWLPYSTSADALYVV